MPNFLRIGIDIGGTFTDFVTYDPDTSTIQTMKILSTPEDPADAVLSGLKLILGARVKDISLIHGSTVATNALLERKGAITALITTTGFRDILQIGRQNRPQLYDLFANPPPPLIPEELRFEVDERVDKHGRILVPLNTNQVKDLVLQLESQNVESIAVSLLFSFAHPEHEHIIAKLMRDANFFVTVSSEVLPEFREYERTSTTAVNAYVSPIMDRYLNNLETGLPPTPGSQNKLAIMQSNGGVIGLADAKKSGVRCILSGPAGGVIGSTYLVRYIQKTRGLDPNNAQIITFDMGGTSTDVSLIDGSHKTTTESQIGGFPIRIPMLDIHTIGAGGGSIASIDMGGALRVGPESAGAYPGPACYGLADYLEDELLLPTVTDANLILGRILADHFLDGRMKLDITLSYRSMADISNKLRLEIHQVALGIIEIANAHMERALRLISIERGYDPKDFTLFAYGGAGGQHAADLARRVGIPEVIIPPIASTLSAFGMLAADIVKDYVKTVMLPGNSNHQILSTLFEQMIHLGIMEVEAQGIPADEIFTECTLDIRYKGQSYELSIPFTVDYVNGFHQRHNRIYGYSRPEAPLEIVNLRVRAVGKVPKPQPKKSLPGDNSPERALLGLSDVMFGVGSEKAPVYLGEKLLAEDQIIGPAIILRSDTTIWIGKKDLVRVDGFGNYILQVAAP